MFGMFKLKAFGTECGLDNVEKMSDSLMLHEVCWKQGFLYLCAENIGVDTAYCCQKTVESSFACGLVRNSSRVVDLVRLLELSVAGGVIGSRRGHARSCECECGTVGVTYFECGTLF